VEAPPVAVTVMTDIPSPYQVELFDAIESERPGALNVIYNRAGMGGRQWRVPNLRHRHVFPTADGPRKARDLVGASDFVVFGGYRGEFFARLIELRDRAGLPWAFWGERPGFRHPGLAGRLARALSQRRVRRRPIPIWGIGAWAVDGYRREIGGDARLYVNVPYCSNLKPFFAIDRSGACDAGAVKILFSGEISQRKGVDLLAWAFRDLARRDLPARLTILGAGTLERQVRRVLAPVAERVAFLGFRQWSELPAIYAEHDILCAPSRYDGWGLIVAEGLAAEMPVIATSAMGAAHELVKTANGWKIHANDPDALRDALAQAVELPVARRRDMGAEGRRVARDVDCSVGARRFWDAVSRSLEAWSRFQ
jgi:glycosyltransferase involved in cell wall biosynthesis